MTFCLKTIRFYKESAWLKAWLSLARNSGSFVFTYVLPGKCLAQGLAQPGSEKRQFRFHIRFARRLPGSRLGSAWLEEAAVSFPHAFCQATAWLKAWLCQAPTSGHCVLTYVLPGECLAQGLTQPGSQKRRFACTSVFAFGRKQYRYPTEQWDT